MSKGKDLQSYTKEELGAERTKLLQENQQAEEAAWELQQNSSPSKSPKSVEALCLPIEEA